MPKGIKGFKKGHKHSELTKLKIGNANRKPFIFYCDYCKKESVTKKSAFLKKEKHFCSMGCYSKYRKEVLPMEYQNSYKGIRKPNESKQIYHKNYCKKHPEKISHLKSMRYAREKGAIGSHSLKEWKDLKNKFNNRCAICGKDKKLTKDHIIPLSKGGTNYIYNIQPLCRNCNSKKWNFIHENPELLESK